MNDSQLIAELQEQVRQQKLLLDNKDRKIIQLTQQVVRLSANKPELLAVYDRTNHGEARLYYNAEAVDVKVMEVWPGDPRDEAKQVIETLPKNMRRLYGQGPVDVLASPYQEEVTMLRAEIYRTSQTYVRTFSQVHEIKQSLGDAIELMKIIKQERDDAVSRLALDTRPTRQAARHREVGPSST